MHAETVKTGLWIGDCFIYTNSVNRLNYYVGGEIVTIAHLDRFVDLLVVYLKAKITFKCFEFSFQNAFIFLQYIFIVNSVNLFNNDVCFAYRNRFKIFFELVQ